MTKKRHGWRALAAGTITAVLALSGCGAGGQAGGGSDGAAGAVTGGTLTVLTSATEMDLDPAKSQGLPTTGNGPIFRRLTAWKITDQGTTELVPDLATTTGETSDEGRTWTYTLKDGLKFSDGTPITAQAIKYGVERSFADALTGGLSYHKTLLEGAQDYHGPFDGQELASIETPDETTIVFHLNAPFGDWPWVVSLAAFTPVPLGQGAAAGYGRTPVASGPYMVESNEPGKQAVYVRNQYWDRASDPVRTAGPDRIVFQMGQDASVAAQSIMQGAGEGRSSFLASFVPAAQLAQAQANPATGKLLVTSGDGALQYLAINTARVTNPKIRQAIEYAVDKQAFQTASGGQIAGATATTLITPGIAGRQEYDLYPAGANGDVDQAMQLIKESGEPAPTLKLIATSAQAETAASIQTGLKRAGITVDIQTLNSDVYTDAATNDEGDYDLVISSWQPDFPSPYANIAPLFDSSQIGHGNYNLARYANPEADALIRQATETVDADAAGRLWAQADRTIMADAPVVPLLYTKNTFIHGADVTDFIIGNFPAYPDYNQVALTTAN